MDTLYQEFILDLYKHPLNKTALRDFDAHHQEHNPVCGDTIELFLRFSDNKVILVGWQGNGCAISQAATSALTDYIKGKKKTELKNITSEEVLKLLGLKNLNPTRLRCATLGLETLKKMV